MPTKHFVHKPLLVQTIQFDPNNKETLKECINFCGSDLFLTNVYGEQVYILRMPSKEHKRVSNRDYLVKDSCSLRVYSEAEFHHKFSEYVEE